ncbi:MAG TPA: response regulator transcription factor [Ohtaekwangia sp.]|jgi:two-component system, OmpR family, copper resistance phosphate regulon response regulator CusR
MNVLVIEDEQKLCASIKKVLEENGYSVDIAYDGQIGERLALKRDYDVMIVDIIIPMINGLELCKRIKRTKPAAPIIMLTALGTTEDKVTGLEAGADDYLLKPFEFAELIARMRAVIRRSNISLNATGAVLQFEDLQLDAGKKVVFRGGKEIELTAKEFQLLEYLVNNPGRLISKAELATKVWDIRSDKSSNVVEVYLNILRKKIDRDFEQKLIHNRKGLGYILQKET